MAAGHPNSGGRVTRQVLEDIFAGRTIIITVLDKKAK